MTRNIIFKILPYIMARISRIFPHLKLAIFDGQPRASTFERAPTEIVKSVVRARKTISYFKS